MKTTKKKPTEWVGNWSDEIAYVRELARDLKDYGIKARTTYSCYVGHRTLQVAKEDVKKAKKVLPDLTCHGEFIASDCLEPCPIW